MAAFRQHIAFSSFLGLGYAAALQGVGIGWTHSALAGGLCGISGMLPDLDSGSGRPLRETFGVTALLVPLLLMRRMSHFGTTPEGALLLGGSLYLLIRFGGAWLFKHLTVHRGMFHSIPAALIAAEVVFLAHDAPERYGRLTLAGGTFLGFLSHLVLDELYSVDARGVKVRLNKAAGSALKFASRSIPATVVTWLFLGALTYLVGIEEGYFQPIHFSVDYPTAQPLQKKARPIPADIPGPPSAGQEGPQQDD